MRLIGLLGLLFVLAVMSPGNPLASGGQLPAPPPTSANGCSPPVPGPDWVCQDGGWLPPGHPLIRASGEPPPPPAPPPTSANGCIPPVPGPDWICHGGNWVPPGHPLLGASVPPAPSTPPAPAVGVPPFECTTSDPFAEARGRFGLLGLFGVCIDGGWVPIGHPLASDYLGRPLAIDYAGIYTLTLIANDCTAEVPDVVKRRVYTATVEQSGATLHVFLEGADFLPGSNRSFTGIVVSADEIRFGVLAADFYYYSGYDLAENIAGVGPVVVLGTFKALTDVSGARMNSALSEHEGFISLNMTPSWECSISRFELTRQ